MQLPDIGGHAIILIRAQQNPAGSTTLTIGDPADGSILTMSYDIFRNNFRGHGGYWIRSYFTKPAY
jgi:hypothetical protein